MCSSDLGQDVHELFLHLTGLTQVPRLTRLIQSPFSLHATIIAKIEREAAYARAGKQSRIIAKMNALVDPEAIGALYRASCAGVRIDLIVRGVCSLRPGVPGVSENIRVRSIVGRFLEHSRVFFFHNNGAENDGDSELFLSSADWMERNFFRRVEIAFPVKRRSHRERILRDLDTYLQDNTQAWELQRDGSYVRLQPGSEPPVTAQLDLLFSYAPGTPGFTAI